ncbi:MAG: hypothetical protein M3Q36_04540, partial [bacterium]|nr:hypothetical protein [bacterium]
MNDDLTYNPSTYEESVGRQTVDPDAIERYQRAVKAARHLIVGPSTGELGVEVTHVTEEIVDDTPRDESGRAILGGRRDRAISNYEAGLAQQHDEEGLRAA